MEYQMMMMEGKVEDMEDDEIRAVGAEMGENQEKDDEYMDDREDNNNTQFLHPRAHSEPISLPHHIICNNITTT